MDDDQTLLEGWKLHGPDHDGYVWLEVQDGDDVSMINLGKLADVREKVMDWLELYDPE